MARLCSSVAILAGFLGAWSAGAQAQTTPPDVTLGGESFPTIAEALAAAVPGDTVMVGAGSLTLQAPLSLVAGVSLQGASARATLLDASNLETGIRVTAGATGSAGMITAIAGLEVSGAARGIEVVDAQGVWIHNVVLRDNQQSGLQVGESAGATLANGTLVRNGVGVAGLGPTLVKNCIITGGTGGLFANRVGDLVSSYNDLFANAGAAYDHVLRGKGDLGFPALFVALEQNDFRLTEDQAITDRGDPSDDFANEPAPNGSRVNLGAFGNTADSELSAPARDKSSGGCAVAGHGAGTAPLLNEIVAALLCVAALAWCGRRRLSRRRTGSDADAHFPQQTVGGYVQ